MPRAISPSDALRRAIENDGRSLASISKAAGVHPSAVCRFMLRQRALVLDKFDAVAGVVGLRIVPVKRTSPRKVPA